MQTAQQIAPDSSKAFDPVRVLAQEAVADGATPGMVLLAAKRGEVLFREAFGHKIFAGPRSADVAPMREETVFDLASLTASVVTATIIMKLIECGKIQLQERVTRYIQGFGILGKSPITVAHLLSHTAGLAPWHPFFDELLRENAGARRGILTSRGARDYIYNAINRMGLKHEIGSKQLYSDIGYMVLGEMIELLTGVGIEKAAFRLIFQPLGMKCSSYVDLSMIKRRGIHPVTDLIAPTEDCPWRKRLLCGEVHDDNAWAMGGIAGHSGLFSTIDDLHLFAVEMLRAYRGQSEFLPADIVRKFWMGPAEFPEGHRFGWDGPTKENGMLDTGLGPASVGVNGFTGCSLWLEPEEGIELILLSNRVCPSRSNRKLFSARPQIIGAMLQTLRSQH